MKIDQQVPRNALAWIIISMFTLVAPHAGRIPLWVLLVYAIAAVWRIMVYRGRWSFPGRWVKLSLIFSGFVGIYLSFGNMLGLEPTVALLLTAFAFKLIESHTMKDAYVLLFLGYFICITEFLFTQDLLIVLYSLVNITLITTGLVALHQPGEHRFNPRTIRYAALMLAQALPLMLVLFFLFPRVGPLWTVPIKSHSAKTGVSDFMKPGDISQLSQADDVAFRVQFDGEIPPPSQLYWRGLVLNRLEEGAWRSLRYFEVPAPERRPEAPELNGEPLRYSVIMEPTQQNWLYALRYAQPASSKLLAASDFNIFSPVEIEDRYQYRVHTWPDTVLEKKLSPWRRETETRLPGNQDPLTREFARELYAQVSTDADFVNAVLSKFNTQPFVYTLQPPTLGEDPMDEFMFSTRRGFCEHYAYAFVVMMRAVGIPARVVAGYQGGEVNPVNRTVIVHQFDAHAWSEVWLQGQGWVRVDPTAAVAPERIEWGLERAMQEEGSFLSDSPLSPLRYRDVDWINLLRLRYDALTYRWQSWMTGFNSDTQYGILEDWLGAVSGRKFAMILLLSWAVSGRKFAMILLLSWAVVLIPVALSLLLKRQTHKLRRHDRHYLAFCDRLAAYGLARWPGEPPSDYAARVIRKAPSLAEPVERMTGAYNALAYGSESLPPEQLRSLHSDMVTAIRGLRRPR